MEVLERREQREPGARGPQRKFRQRAPRFGAFGNKITQYEGGKELVPGITSVFTPGHTPGHMSHLITSGSDRVMVQGDVSAGMAFLFVQNPEWELQFGL